MDLRLTARAVEIFLHGERIAAHLRGSGDGKHTTRSKHMPASHRRYSDWTIERMLSEARACGPSVALLMSARSYGAVKSILDNRLDG